MRVVLLPVVKSQWGKLGFLGGERFELAHPGWLRRWRRQSTAGFRFR